ncbi:STAS domain-containing protein [Desulfovibrio inopinatus]|uniref:STAS domain-containing protein n=1 Tax=Desulfovibrio inopinatus TaxID=102109 RepID=UPI0004085DA6|nr:STAS domain-containing protein [Desulfovibrio inopinatus]
MEKLNVCNKNGAAIIDYEGEITIEITPEIKQVISEVIENNDVSAVVLDLSRVSFMDSSGIGFLVSCNTRLQNAGKELFLYRPSSQVCKTLELVQLLNFFEVAEDEDELTALLPE